MSCTHFTSAVKDSKFNLWDTINRRIYYWDLGHCLPLRFVRQQQVLYAKKRKNWNANICQTNAKIQWHWRERRLSTWVFAMAYVRTERKFKDKTGGRPARIRSNGNELRNECWAATESINRCAVRLNAEWRTNKIAKVAKIQCYIRYYIIIFLTSI